MKNINYFFLFLILLASCDAEHLDIYRLKGKVLDEITQQPVANIEVEFSAVGPVGLFGTRKRAGSATSDSKGNFECKLKVFEGAAEVDPFVNTLNYDNYALFRGHQRIPINELKNYKNNPYIIYLFPTSILLIHFKNVNPVSASDYFYMDSVDPLDSDFSSQRLFTHNCGDPIVLQNGAFTNEFIGQNVCGTYKFKTAANSMNRVKWKVRKNNEMKEESVDIYCPQGEVTEFTIEY